MTRLWSPRDVLRLFITLLIFWLPLAKCSQLASPTIETRAPLPTPRSNETAWAVTCVYPVSGQYTLFQRILLYLVMAFIFLLQFHEWLTAAAVAYMLTYTTTAGIHGIFVSSQPSVGHDLDSVALEGIVCIAGLAGVVFALWSPPILKKDATRLFIIWSLFMSSSFFSLHTQSYRWIEGETADLLLSICDETGACDDPCSSFAVSTYFHSADDALRPIFLSLVDLDISARNTTIKISSSSSASPYDTDNPFAAWHLVVAYAFTFGIIVQTRYNHKHRLRIARNNIFSYYISRRGTTPHSPSRGKTIVVRIFRWTHAIWSVLLWDFLLGVIIQGFFMGFYSGEPRPKSGFRRDVIENPSKKRRTIAKTFAFICYCWGGLAYLIWPAILIYSITFIETRIHYLPEAESPEAVGQWSSWVGVGLAVTVGLINRTCFAVKSKKEDPPPTDDSELQIPAFRHQNLIPNTPDEKPYWYYCWYGIDFLIDEWKDLKAWWRDPVKASGYDERVGVEPEAQDDDQDPGTGATQPGQAHLPIEGKLALRRVQSV